ncbi:MAG: porphobilinogen synthase [Candidatus Geothermincolales bacterium]
MKMLRENSLDHGKLIQPLFILPGRGLDDTDSSLPGILRVSADLAPGMAGRMLESGLNALLLFGVPEKKSPRGENALSSSNPLFLALDGIKRKFPEAVLISDICLCSFTESGHCGVVRDGKVDNDETLELLSRYAVAAAECGSDMVAPSAMMDGMVSSIRKALDSRGLTDTLIMSYSAKFASSLYGPFRQAASSAPREGDRSGYQLPPTNLREALRELDADQEEGADMLMIKPALPYLDLLAEARRRTLLPLAAYNVSGEYAMIKAASREGHLDERKAVEEILLSMFRAGADMVITYHAWEVARWKEK